MALDALGEIGTYPLVAVVNSFRYVFSPQFRTKTHNRWKQEKRHYIVGEVAFSAIFTLVSLGLLVYLAWAIIS